MSKELKITKERIKKLHDGLSGCSEAQDAIKDAFPEAFGEEWVDVTGKIEWVFESDCLVGCDKTAQYKGNVFIAKKIELNHPNEDRYRVKESGVYRFRLLKRK